MKTSKETEDRYVIIDDIAITDQELDFLMHTYPQRAGSTVQEVIRSIINDTMATFHTLSETEVAVALAQCPTCQPVWAQVRNEIVQRMDYEQELSDQIANLEKALTQSLAAIQVAVETGEMREDRYQTEALKSVVALRTERDQLLEACHLAICELDAIGTNVDRSTYYHPAYIALKKVLRD